MAKTPEKTVVLVTSGPIEMPNDDDGLVFDMEGNLEGGGRYGLQRYMKEVRSARLPGVPDFLRNRRRKACSNIPVVETVRGKALRVICLVNSEGGLASIVDMYKFFFEQVREDGGEVVAMIANRACSASAMVVNYADRRIATDDSWFVWHMPQDRLGEGRPMDGFERERREEVWQEMRDSILAGISGEYRDEMRASLERAKVDDPDDALYSIDGGSLNQYGFVDELCSDLIALRLRFAQLLRVDENFRGLNLDDIDGILRFFIFAQIEKELDDIYAEKYDGKYGYLEFSLWLDKQDDKIHLFGEKELYGDKVRIPDAIRSEIMEYVEIRWDQLWADFG